MPFKSQAQRAWMYANKPEMAKEWESKTPSGALPDRVKPAPQKPKKLPKYRPPPRGHQQ